jgi:hypothetical protein
MNELQNQIHDLRKSHGEELDWMERERKTMSFDIERLQEHLGVESMESQLTPRALQTGGQPRQQGG